MTRQTAAKVASSGTTPPPNVATCQAWGCPLHGSIDSSTVGAPRWVCIAHHGAPSTRWQRITAELRRVLWLVEAIRMLRHTVDGPEWDEAWQAAQRRLIGAQRRDLAWLEDETASQWIKRLEAELMRIARHEQTAQPQLPIDRN